MTGITLPPEQLRQRLMSRVRIAPEAGCWEWSGALRKRRNLSYGLIVIRGRRVRGRRVRAHRLSYELHVGPIPEGLGVLHRCDNARCVNPDHLFLGTQQDNIADMDAKGRRVTPKGERNRAIVTEEQVKEMRLLRQAGWSVASLCGRYGLCDSAVRYIIARKRWSHVA